METHGRKPCENHLRHPSERQRFCRKTILRHRHRSDGCLIAKTLAACSVSPLHHCQFYSHYGEVSDRMQKCHLPSTEIADCVGTGTRAVSVPVGSPDLLKPHTRSCFKSRGEKVSILPFSKPRIGAADFGIGFARFLGGVFSSSNATF